jgi:hypothetical protein
MDEFIQQHRDRIIGSISGFDRLVFTGTLRALCVTCGMMDYLNRVGVRLKDFGSFVETKSNELKQASLAAAQRLQRPIQYLPSPKTSKEDTARAIAERDGVREGLIGVLTAVEPCQTYEIYRDRERKRITLEPRRRKCLFLYHYWLNPEFGFMHARIQTWFPFTIRVCLNGREWLARQMDRCGLGYVRADNCFPRIDRPDEAQRLLDTQLHTDWPARLQEIAGQLNPAHEQMLAPYRTQYYWSTYQSEWATDVMFESPRALAALYPQFTRQAIGSFGSRDVMRFLGKKPSHFLGELVSDYKHRPEGVRVKHRLKANSIKMYDKAGSILRVETTINDPRDFKVFRCKEGQNNGPKSWNRMRKGVADLHRLTQVSHAANQRYLDALAVLDLGCSVADVVAPACKPTRWKGHRVRALRPWAPRDIILFQALHRGEFALNGFRNRDLVALLHGTTLSADRRKFCASQVTYQLRMLRAHGLIRKIAHTHRYVLSPKGQAIVTAILSAYNASVKQLAAIAA